MAQHKRQRTLRVRLMGMSDQSRVVLNYYLANTGREYFRPVTAHDQADVFIFDYDYPGAAQEWRRINEHHQAPSIIFSVRKVVLPHSVWVSKPLTLKGMNRAALDIEQLWRDAGGQGDPDATVSAASVHASTGVAQEDTMANDSIPVLTRIVSSADLSANIKPADEGAGEEANDDGGERSEKRRASSEIGADVQSHAKHAAESPALYRQELLCGKQTDVSVNSWARHGELFFPAEEFLSSHVLKGVRMMQDTGRIVSVVSSPFEFCIFSGLNRIYSNLALKDTDKTELLSQPVEKEYVKIKAVNATELRRTIARIKAKQGFVYDLEALLWSLSLLSSRGRIPLGTDPQCRAWLKFWPNFTRLETFPYCMEIAALWSQQSRSLADAVDQLKIPQRYVIAFFNGAHALDLFDSKHPESEQHVHSQLPGNRGFFKDLFSRFRISNSSQY